MLGFNEGQVSQQKHTGGLLISKVQVLKKQSIFLNVFRIIWDYFRCWKFEKKLKNDFKNTLQLFLLLNFYHPLLAGDAITVCILYVSWRAYHMFSGFKYRTFLVFSSFFPFF